MTEFMGFLYMVGALYTIGYVSINRSKNDSIIDVLASLIVNVLIIIAWPVFLGRNMRKD